MRRSLWVALGLTVWLAGVAWIPTRRLRHRPAPAELRLESTVRLAGALYEGERAVERAWPGYRPFSQPLLIAYQDGGAVLIRARTLPRGFLRARSVAATPRRFDVRFSYVDAFNLDGTTVTALRVHYPFELWRQESTVLHERFHEHQRRAFHEKPHPRYSIEEPLDMTLAAVENRRLADWLDAGDPEAIRDFAAARLRRRRLFPGTAAEDWEERIEGTAQFVETAAFEASTGAVNAARYAARRLRARFDLESMRKSRAYEVGVALCRWLDAERVPDWRRRVEAGAAPADLVLERLSLAPDEESRRIKAAMRRPEFGRAERLARADIAWLRRYRDGERDVYAGIPGRSLVFKEPMKGGFSAQEWLQYPNDESFLVVSELVQDRPGVHLRLGPNKAVWWRKNEFEFKLPVDARLILDGAPWKLKAGRTSFSSLKISTGSIQASFGPGELRDDGRVVRLTVQ